MTYFVFSRKYRPQKFAEVLAQKHITETLTKAIEHNRVSQAYLFCGVRGTGKTSVARILAKRLNCTAPEGAEPCDKCDSCLSIVKGHSLDILEIDAASHTSVDDIRELRESIKYSPVGGKHKVYIIDEVHRLSPSAFDALLKTLEEPPAHAVFIFATTEVHKVPQTILSRCQRYDFRRIPESELKSALAEIARKESLNISDDALAELAKRGDGSLRDALSILDQVASWQHEVIDLKLLTEALGILPRSEYRAVIKLIRERQLGAIIDKVNEILRSGIGAGEFIRGFQEEVRLMLLFKAAPEIISEYGISTADASEYKALCEPYSLSDLLRMQNLLVNLEQKIKEGFDPVVNIELTMLKLAEMEKSVSLEHVLKKLSAADSESTAFSLSPPEPSESKKKLEVKFAPSEAPKPPSVQTTQTEVSALPAVPSISSSELMTIWQGFLNALKSSHRNLQIKLTLAQPRGVENNRISVAFDRMGEFHVRQLQDREIQQTLEQVMRNTTGRNFRFHFFVDKKIDEKGENGKKIGLLSESEKLEHPLIVQAMETFDADVVGRRDLEDK